MLFTDTVISTISDLAAYESDIRDLASVANLDLDTKLGRAQMEVGVELLGATVAHALDSSAGPSFTLDQVVVTDALRLWHVFHTLTIVYRDAYNRKLNDKYLLKWKDYGALSKWASHAYFNIGVGLVLRPLPAPGRPAVSVTAGGALPAAIYFVRATWVDAQGRESGPSELVSQSAAASELLTVSLAGQQPPAGAAGWFPYAGTDPDGPQRQVSAPVAAAEAWTMPAGGLIAGTVVSDGQGPDYYRQITRNLQRG